MSKSKRKRVSRRLFACPRCHRRDAIRMGVNLFLDIPQAFYAKLSKQNILSSKTRITGAGWDRAYFYCENCGWDPRLSEVELLRKENARLQRLLAEAKEYSR